MQAVTHMPVCAKAASCTLYFDLTDATVLAPACEYYCLTEPPQSDVASCKMSHCGCSVYNGTLHQPTCCKHAWRELKEAVVGPHIVQI